MRVKTRPGGAWAAAAAAALLTGGVTLAWLVALSAAPRPKEERGPAVKTTTTRTSENGAADLPVRLEAHVRMLSETLAPRDHEHGENLDRVAAYVAGELRAAGAAEVVEQPFTAGGRTYRNVLARFGPEEGERVVVGAHYDAAGPYPGADDNASAVAGLLELAHLLGAGSAPRLRVDLVAFTLEEPPYFATSDMGSAVHAASLRRAGAQIRAMLCLEMIGYFSDEPGSQRFPVEELRARYPTTGNFITVVGRPEEATLTRSVEAAMRSGGAPLPVYSLIAPAAMPGVSLSDHRNYWQTGYPALMITDGSFYRNPHYHTPEDTADTLDYPRLALVVRGVHAAVAELAGGAAGTFKAIP